MDLKSLGVAIAKLGLPLLGAALPLPGGAAIGQALAGAIGSPTSQPEGLLAALSANADAFQRGKEFEATHQETLMRISVDAEIRAVEAVNKTMQSEAASDHWPTYTWRPFMGFIAGFMILSNYVVAPLVGRLPVAIDPTAWLFLGSILGVASFFRGKMQADPTTPSDNRG